VGAFDADGASVSGKGLFFLHDIRLLFFLSRSLSQSLVAGSSSGPPGRWYWFSLGAFFFPKESANFPYAGAARFFFLPSSFLLFFSSSFLPFFFLFFSYSSSS
jgi:hypothetical protein